MNSASMATNLLGRPVRLREAPELDRARTGRIVLVAIDQQGVHFLVEMEGRLLFVDRPDKLEVLN